MTFTKHATKRCCQRGIKKEHVSSAMAWGIRFRQTKGRTVYFIGDRSVKKAESQGEDIKDLKGLAVIFSREFVVITVIKISHLHKIKRRLK